MPVRTDLIQHYPWLPSLKRNYTTLASKDPIEFIKEIFQKAPSFEIEERILKLFKAAFENLEEISDYKIDELNVRLYLILKILLYLLNNKIIANRMANLYSKINYDELLKEIDKENYYIIYNICEDLNIDVLYNEKPWEYGKNIYKDQQETLKTKFKIHYTDYLKLVAMGNLKDEYRKLINNSISNGYVFVQEKRLARLLQEYVRKKFIITQEENTSELEAFKKEALKIEKFKDLYDNIFNLWSLREDEFEYLIEIDFAQGKDVSSSYPPCAKEILKKAQEGQNLTHNERLFIVWFLLAFNYPVDQIVNIFSTLPDFDRGKTEYQVNYAKRKGYNPYKCSTLKSFNLCLATNYKDDLCLKGYYSKKQEKEKNITHPLSYVRIAQYRASRKKDNTNNQSNKKDE